MKAVLLIKAHNRGYTRKDGTVVRPFNDKRPSAKPDHKKQQNLFGLNHVTKPQPKQKLEPKAYHPKAGENGEAIGIYNPSKATDPSSWENPNAVATFVPGGDEPKSLNGVPFRAWRDHPKTDDGWDYVEGQMDDLDEPPMDLPPGMKAASGVIIEEPDGRVWIVHPTNKFAGYSATFPKGTAEQHLSLQSNAIKECFEESGLKVEITGFLGDFERTTSVARFYTARRVGGRPSDMGWESQAVSLVPKSKLMSLLNGTADHEIGMVVRGRSYTPVPPESANGWQKIGGQLGSNPGGFYRDENGVEWYCKLPKSADHAHNEILASKLYEELGIRTPQMKLITMDGMIGVASRVIPVLVKDRQGLIDGSVRGVREGFAADAWLANWDSVGLVYDNMLVDASGEAVRVDPGGSLLFRAQGSPKGNAFGDSVTEIETLRNGQNRQAAEVFAQVTDRDIKNGVQKIAELSDERIHRLVEMFGPGNPHQRAKLADKLIARKKDLIRRFL